MTIPPHNTFRILVLAMAAPSLRAQELKLEDAIQLAIEHNKEIANAKLEVAKSEERMAAYHTNLLPSAHIYALGAQQLGSTAYTIERGQLGTFAATGPIPSNDVKFSTSSQPTAILTGRVSQPLTGIYKTKLNLAALDLSKQLDQEKFRARSQDVVRDVKKLYYEIQETESSLRVTHEVVALYRELERIMEDYVLKQVALEPDHLEAQTHVSRAEEDQLKIRNEQAGLKEQLNQLLGRGVFTEFTVTPIGETAQLPVDLVVARQRALDQRPEVREAQIKVRHAEQEVRVKRADYLPDVSAELNTSRYLNFSSFVPSHSTSVGVSLSWDPMDWGRRKHELAEKKYSVEQNKNSEADVRSKVIIDVDTKYRQMRQIQSQFRTVRLSQRTALEQLRVVKRRFEVEAVLLKEVLQVQTTLEQANNDYQQTLAKFLTAQAEFEHALGEDQ